MNARIMRNIYDLRGNMIKNIEIYGNNYQITEYGFGDGEDNLLYSVDTTLLGETKISINKTIHYDEEDRVVMIESYDNKWNDIITEYEYLATGEQIIKVESTKKNKYKLILEKLFSEELLDDKGRILHKVEYSLIESKKKTEYEYSLSFDDLLNEDIEGLSYLKDFIEEDSFYKITCKESDSKIETILYSPNIDAPLECILLTQKENDKAVYTSTINRIQKYNTDFIIFKSKSVDTKNSLIYIIAPNNNLASAFYSVSEDELQLLNDDLKEFVRSHESNYDFFHKLNITNDFLKEISDEENHYLEYYEDSNKQQIQNCYMKKYIIKRECNGTIIDCVNPVIEISFVAEYESFSIDIDINISLENMGNVVMEQMTVLDKKSDDITIIRCSTDNCYPCGKWEICNCEDLEYKLDAIIEKRGNIEYIFEKHETSVNIYTDANRNKLLNCNIIYKSENKDYFDDYLIEEFKSLLLDETLCDRIRLANVLSGEVIKNYRRIATLDPNYLDFIV